MRRKLNTTRGTAIIEWTIIGALCGMLFTVIIVVTGPRFTNVTANCVTFHHARNGHTQVVKVNGHIYNNEQGKVCT